MENNDDSRALHPLLTGGLFMAVGIVFSYLAFELAKDLSIDGETGVRRGAQSLGAALLWSIALYPLVYLVALASWWGFKSVGWYSAATIAAFAPLTYLKVIVLVFALWVVTHGVALMNPGR